MNNNSFTLVIWEEVPENTTLYLIPNQEVEIDNRLKLMKMAHNKFINMVGVEENEGMRFLNAALVSEDHINDDRYFDDGFLHTSNGPVKVRDPIPNEWKCIFAKYKLDSDQPIEANITRVILSGFLL